MMSVVLYIQKNEVFTETNIIGRCYPQSDDLVITAISPVVL